MAEVFHLATGRGKSQRLVESPCARKCVQFTLTRIHKTVYCLTGRIQHFFNFFFFNACQSRSPIFCAKGPIPRRNGVCPLIARSCQDDCLFNVGSACVRYPPEKEVVWGGVGARNRHSIARSASKSVCGGAYGYPWIVAQCRIPRGKWTRVP